LIKAIVLCRGTHLVNTALFLLFVVVFFKTNRTSRLLHRLAFALVLDLSGLRRDS
jgi:hypothetical protein